jgi:hypothetical protein
MVRSEIMTPDEVVNTLKKMGVEITRRTLLNYENWGLIPKPKRGGLGRGKGRTTYYPDETPAEAYAAWRSIKNKQVDDLRAIRDKAKEIENDPEKLQLILDNFFESADIDIFACIWLREKKRVLRGEPLSCQTQS